MSMKKSHFIKTSSQKKNFKCTATPALWCSFILSSVVLLALSYWQLDKGLDQLQIKQTQAAVVAANPTKSVTLATAFKHWMTNPSSINDSLASVQGYFEPQFLILHDNRILNGRPGYAVYMPFRQITSNKTTSNKNTSSETQEKPVHFTHILVNLGWHPIVNFDRKLIPSIALKSHKSDLNVINVSLEHIHDAVFTLDTDGIQRMYPRTTPSEGTNIQEDQVFRVQKIRFDELNSQLGFKFAPFVARSTSSLTEPNLPTLHLPLTRRGISAEKHFGYSVQWFIFWLIAVGVFVYTQCSWYAVGRLNQGEKEYCSENEEHE